MSVTAIQQQIKFVSGYIKMIQDAYKDAGETSVNDLVLILQIFRADLRRRIKTEPEPVTLDWMDTLNTGGRVAAKILENLCTQEAEALGDWQLGDVAENHQQGLAGILVVLIEQFHKQITEAEREYPDLELEFDYERLHYYALKDEAANA